MLYLLYLHCLIAGEFQVGFITFNMSLSINILDLVPHISELAALIAHDLDVNVSQVRGDIFSFLVIFRHALCCY